MTIGGHHEDGQMPMTDQTGEKVSAFLDGQLPADETKRVLDDMLVSESEIDRLGRYRLIGDAMRGEFAVDASAIVGRVHEDLADEPTVLAPRPSRPSLPRLAAGLALAASVATVAIVVAPGLLEDGAGTSGVIVAEQSAGELPSTTLQIASRATPAASTLGDSEDALQRRLNRLVIEHQEFGGRSGLYGPVPHIGLVSYDR